MQRNVSVRGRLCAGRDPDGPLAPDAEEALVAEERELLAKLEEEER